MIDCIRWKRGGGMGVWNGDTKEQMKQDRILQKLLKYGMWQKKCLEFNIPGELASVPEQLISYCIFYVNPPYSVDKLIRLLSYRHTWTIPSQAFFPAWDLPRAPDQAAYV